MISLAWNGESERFFPPFEGGQGTGIPPFEGGQGTVLSPLGRGVGGMILIDYIRFKF
jgi:hypothetical protein